MRKWFGLILALLAIAALLLVLVALGRGLLSVLRSTGSVSSPDPMFAEPAIVVTRPPELIKDAQTRAPLGEDPSAAWVYDETTPVDRTAAELAREYETASP